jgi:hypothetical protein
MEFRDHLFSCVFLYSNKDKKFKQFPGRLPFSLNFDMNNSDIVGFLGEPNKKVGGGSTPISLSYERIGVEFTLLSPSWDFPDNKINFICLFPPLRGEDQMICSLCKKPSKSFCGQCGLVWYCSEDCQKTHWKIHKFMCKKYAESKK